MLVGSGADHLVRQQLLQPVSETIFEVREELREQFGRQPGDATPHVTPHVDPHVIQFLAKVSGDMTRQELMDLAEIRDRKHFAEAYLQPALETGLLEMTIPDKPTSIKQRYRLTNLGRAALEQDKA